MTIGRALAEAEARLDVAGVPDSRRDAEVLVGAALGVGRAALVAHRERELSDDQVVRLAAMLARRQRREPVAYILGVREFWSLEMAVSPAVLIPRPDTERLVELALGHLGLGPARAADIGTGSGAVAVALATERAELRVLATDSLAGATEVARHNVARLGLTSRVSIRQGSLFEPLAGERFEVIASNPPYIASPEYAALMPEVRDWEPRGALVAGADGLDVIRPLVAGAPAHLVEGGWLLVEHGPTQGRAVRRLFEAVGLVEVRTDRDYAGRERVTSGSYLRQHDEVGAG